ncbi:MAG: hypothetical protein HGA76_07315 [Candidatus Firestonebacteria bacterium]|nr:hypothetical protein [Candidatus Firestonebacteria bacterium]
MPNRLHRHLTWILLAGSLLGNGCVYADLPRRVDGFLLTFYTLPRELHRGEARVALRVQDRDYRVLTQARASLVVVDPAGNSQPAVDLVFGAAKDYRARVTFPQGGEYRLAFKVLPAPGGRHLISVYPVRVSE